MAPEVIRVTVDPRQIIAEALHFAALSRAAAKLPRAERRLEGSEAAMQRGPDMTVGTAEMVFRSAGRTWFRIFADRRVSSAEAAAETARLGYPNAKPRGFDCQDLMNAPAPGYVATWYVEEDPR